MSGPRIKDHDRRLMHTKSKKLGSSKLETSQTAPERTTQPGVVGPLRRMPALGIEHDGGVETTLVLVLKMVIERCEMSTSVFGQDRASDKGPKV